MLKERHERVPGFPDNSWCGASSCKSPWSSDKFQRQPAPTLSPPSCPPHCALQRRPPVSLTADALLCSSTSSITSKKSPASCLWDTSITAWQVAGGSGQKMAKLVECKTVFLTSQFGFPLGCIHIILSLSIPPQYLVYRFWNYWYLLPCRGGPLHKSS